MLSISKIQFLLIILLTATVQLAQAQAVNIPEPKWSGESVYLADDGEAMLLDVEKAYFKTKTGISLYLVGIGKVKSKVVVDGRTSSLKVPERRDVQFIVNAGANNLRPESIIQIVPMSLSKKNNRFYVGAEVASFKESKVGNYETVRFHAEPYQKKSYLVTVPNIEKGEYALIINGSMQYNMFTVR